MFWKFPFSEKPRGLRFRQPGDLMGSPKLMLEHLERASEQLLGVFDEG